MNKNKPTHPWRKQLSRELTIRAAKKTAFQQYLEKRKQHNAELRMKDAAGVVARREGV